MSRPFLGIWNPEERFDKPLSRYSRLWQPIDKQKYQYITIICCLYFLATVFLASGAPFDKLRKRFNLYAIHQVLSQSFPSCRTYRRAHQYKTRRGWFFVSFLLVLRNSKHQDKRKVKSVSTLLRILPFTYTNENKAMGEAILTAISISWIIRTEDDLICSITNNLAAMKVITGTFLPSR